MRLLSLFFILLFGPFSEGALSTSNNNDWFHSAGNFQAHRYTTNNQINKSNIKQLDQIWVYRSGHINKNDTVQSSPIFTGGKIISSTSLGDIYALNPINGKEIWRTHLGQPAARRGLTFYNGSLKKIFAPTNQGIVEINENTGKVEHTYTSGISLLAPIIQNNQLIIATLSNGIKSFDLETKNLLWEVNLTKNNVSPRIWSGFSFNDELGIVYAITGSSDGLTGFNRKTDDNSVSVIAVDVNTGNLVWTFQHIQHDVWDLDLVGNPMPLKLRASNQDYYALVALTKTGDILLLNAKNGKPIFENSFQKVPVPQSRLKGEVLSEVQKLFTKPEPFSNIIVDPDNDFDHLDKDNLNFIDAKLRNAKYGFFIPPSVDYDVVMYGLHGGAEWPGGSIDFSGSNPALIVPFNRDPWILRVYHDDKIYRLIYKVISKINSFKNHSSEYLTPWTAFQSPEVETVEKIFSKLPTTPKNDLYIKQCSSCHGRSRQGTYQAESEGDKIYPPLVGIKFTDKWKAVSDTKRLNNVHKQFDIDLDINEIDYQNMMDSYHDYDQRLQKYNMLGYSSMWQILLDKDGYPATKPPWGFISKISLAQGQIDWKIPFGAREDISGLNVAKGDKNFGGVLSTKTKIIFATGTPAKFLYAFDTDTGQEIWKHKIPFSGSAPPASFLYKGCQMILTQATGGRFVGYQSTGDALVAFKLKSCNFQEDNF